MGVRLGLRLDGADAVRARLARVDLDERAIALAAAGPIRARARVVVPRRTGRLMRSITLGGAGDRVVIAATAPYAAEVAYGGPTNPNPVPFMEIAVRGSGSAARAAAVAEVGDELRRAGL